MVKVTRNDMRRTDESAVNIATSNVDEVKDGVEASGEFTKG